MSHVTDSPRDAASVLSDLTGHRVSSAVDLLDGPREVTVVAATTQAAGLECGAVSGQGRQRTRRRLRDVPVAGRVEVVLVRRRFAHCQLWCGRRTFVDVSDEVPTRSRSSRSTRGGLPSRDRPAAARGHRQHRCVSPGQARQDGDRCPAAGHAPGQGPQGLPRGPVVGEPAAAAARGRHLPCAAPAPLKAALAVLSHGRPDRRDRRRSGRERTPAPAAPRLDAGAGRAPPRRAGRGGPTVGDARDLPPLRHHAGVGAGDRGPRRHRRHQRPHPGGNTSVEQIERSGGGYRNPTHYKARILPAGAARRPA